MSDNKTKQAKYLFDSISIMIASALNRAKFNRKKKASIHSLNGDGTVNITLNDELYSNIKVRSGLSLEVNDLIWLELPNGNMSDMFVDMIL